MTFRELFESRISMDSVPSVFYDAAVLHMTLEESTRTLELKLRVRTVPAYEDIERAEDCLNRLLSAKVRAELCFPAEALNEQAFATIIPLLRRRHMQVNGSFNDAVYSIVGDRVYVKLAHGGAGLLRSTQMDTELETLIRDLFGVRVTVEFQGDETVDTNDEQYQRLMQQAMEEEQQRAQEAAATAAAAAAAAVKSDGAPAPAKPRTAGVDFNRPPTSGLPIYLETAQTIWGKDIREMPVPIRTVEPDGSFVTVWGEVFGMEKEHRESRDGTRVLYEFHLSDRTGSLTVNMWLDKKRDKQKLEALASVKNGVCVLAQGSYDYNEYAKCNVLRIKSMALVAKYQKPDNAPKKRVELHMHTKMSSMDAVSEASDLVTRAADWGHPAVAITDHGVVQAFPDAMNTAAKLAKGGKEIKVLYGVEAYYINDMIPVVTGDATCALTDECIVFDLETTGLSQQNDRITEIGAVRVRDGAVVEEFNTFVNPEMPISEKITELTGITNDMVKDAPREDEALRLFYEFCGDCKVIIAHNAPFDTGFVKKSAERCDMPYPFTSIDTVPIARALYPNLKNHKLDTVAKALQLPPFNHHRACDDARVLAQIYLKLITDMKEQRGVETVDGINTGLKGGDMKGVKPYHLIILAQNLTGLKNLYKLISWSHLKNYFKRPRITRSKLMEHREGLIIGSACEQGELFEAVVDGRGWGELCDIAVLRFSRNSTARKQCVYGAQRYGARRRTAQGFQPYNRPTR